MPSIEQLTAQLSLAESRGASVERIADDLAKALERMVSAINAGFGKPQRDHIKGQADLALTAYREQQKASQAASHAVRQD